MRIPVILLLSSLFSLSIIYLLPAYHTFYTPTLASNETFSGSFCAKAIPVSCGQTLTNQNTAGAGNAVVTSDYNNCTNVIPAQYSFNGEDRVYRLQLNTASTLQLSLSILDAGIDLDLFVFNDCGGLESAGCVVAEGTSDSRNTGTDFVQVFLQPGTYYIVVDRYDNEFAARFNLQISCEEENSGTDFCEKAIPVSCNQTLNNQTTVGAGNSLVAADYNSCENILQSNNSFNAPDKIYQVILEEATTLKLSLQIFAEGVDLDLFVFENCEGAEIGTMCSSIWHYG